MHFRFPIQIGTKRCPGGRPTERIAAYLQPVRSDRNFLARKLPGGKQNHSHDRRNVSPSPFGIHDEHQSRSVADRGLPRLDYGRKWSLLCSDDEAIYADDGFDRKERRFRNDTTFYAAGESTVIFPRGNIWSKFRGASPKSPCMRKSKFRNHSRQKSKSSLSAGAATVGRPVGVRGSSCSHELWRHLSQLAVRVAMSSRRRKA